MLVSELIYACLDLAKASTSDDSFWTEEHVVFLCKKFRAFLIKREQEREKSAKDVTWEFEQQQICLDLEPSAAIDGEPCTGGYYLRTKQEIPKMLEGTVPRVYPIDFYQGVNINYVSRDRMRYVGTNPYLRNIIYVSLGPDFHLYMNSSNPQFKYLKKLRMNAVFEDFEEALKYSCDADGDTVPCDVLDTGFPIRDYMVPELINLVVKELTGAVYKPSDTANNANDDLSDIAAYLRRNMKSGFQQQIEG